MSRNSKKASFLVGFDGFIDTLYHAVQHRLNRMEYSPFSSMHDFGAYVQAASHKNCNVESVRIATSLGGNAPLVALGLSSLSHTVQLIGCLGYPNRHPLFPTGISIGEPGNTSAYEFQDGKLMLGSMNDVLSVTMKELLERCPNLSTLIRDAQWLVTTNWTMCPLVEEFWKWLLKLPKEALNNKALFIDLADPKKRSKKELQQALQLIVDLSRRMPCCLGLNLSEATLVASALDLTPKNTIHELTQQLWRTCPTLSFYLHSSKEVAAVNSSGTFEQLSVDYTTKPVRLTGAGDMFHAGILSALSEGLPLKKQLQRALLTSSHWVRNGSPLLGTETPHFG